MPLNPYYSSFTPIAIHLTLKYTPSHCTMPLFLLFFIYTSPYALYSYRNELGQHSPEALAKSLKDIEDVRALTGNAFIYMYTHDIIICLSYITCIIMFLRAICV